MDPTKWTILITAISAAVAAVGIAASSFFSYHQRAATDHSRKIDEDEQEYQTRVRRLLSSQELRHTIEDVVRTSKKVEEMVNSAVQRGILESEYGDRMRDSIDVLIGELQSVRQLLVVAPAGDDHDDTGRRRHSDRIVVK